ncbi:MAG: glycosyltransferase [Chlorobi bacterium]|nr:glycosyltransferase [Chlorobiota bacterium]
MTAIEYLLVTAVVLYGIEGLIFIIGAHKASRVRRSEYRPFVSVIVAARNEEKNIETLLSSLEQLTYPVSMREIIIVDDESTDATASIVESWKDRIPGLILMQPRGTLDGLKGKANAVAQAIESSKGEIILTTDADCHVPPGWIEDLMSLYTPEVGVVCGFTLLRGNRVFEIIQSLDWAYLITIAVAGVAWNVPLSAVATNMSFRRKAYDEVGGYPGVGFSVTEDFALFKKISYATNWKLRYPMRRENLVWSAACDDWRGVYLQKKRWGKGGVDIHPAGFAIMIIGFAMSCSLLVLPFFGLSWMYWFIAFSVKSVWDAAILFVPLKKFNLLRWFKYFPIFEIYYIIYVILIPFIVFLTGKVEWKGRKY